MAEGRGGDDTGEVDTEDQHDPSCAPAQDERDEEHREREQRADQRKHAVVRGECDDPLHVVDRLQRIRTKPSHYRARDGEQCPDDAGRRT